MLLFVRLYVEGSDRSVRRRFLRLHNIIMQCVFIHVGPGNTIMGWCPDLVRIHT